MSGGKAKETDNNLNCRRQVGAQRGRRGNSISPPALAGTRGNDYRRLQGQNSRLVVRRWWIGGERLVVKSNMAGAVIDGGLRGPPVMPGPYVVSS